MRYPESPAPLSNQDTYTTWPGGVDPTARVYDSVGGKRRGSKRSRAARFAAKSPRATVQRRRKTPKRRHSRKARKMVASKRRRMTRRQ